MNCHVRFARNPASLSGHCCAMPCRATDDPTALKAMILALQVENARMGADITKTAATLRAHEALVQALQIQIARLKKQKFGTSSERTLREIEQLELALEHLEIAGAATISMIAPDDDAELSEVEQATAPTNPRRRNPLMAEGTPRERIVLDPGEDCPHYGGTLRLVGEDVSEILELIAARLKVIETARLKKSCRRCEKITQLPAPSRRSAGKLSPRQFPDPPHSAQHGRPGSAGTCPPSRRCKHRLPGNGCRSSTITFRSIARTRSLPGWAQAFRPRPWSIGAAKGLGC